MLMSAKCNINFLKAFHNMLVAILEDNLFIDQRFGSMDIEVVSDDDWIQTWTLNHLHMILDHHLSEPAHTTTTTFSVTMSSRR